MDGPETGAVPSGHILVHALDGICTRQLAELLVHVVGSRTRVVAQPDAKVLDFQWLLFMNLCGRRVRRILKNNEMEWLGHSHPPAS